MKSQKKLQKLRRSIGLSPAKSARPIERRAEAVTSATKLASENPARAEEITQRTLRALSAASRPVRAN